MTPPWPALSLVLAFDDEATEAEALARQLACPLALVVRHRFPDGELKLTLPTPLQGTVLLYRGLHQPNEKLVELMITAPAARALGAERLLLVCPYLAYMRQDIAFHPGEAVSQRHIAGLLASRFDGLVTVDPHLHRIASLDEVMPGCRALSLSAAGLLGRWVAQQVPQPLLLGPDGEAEQWVREAAQASGSAGAWCLKERHGDREVAVKLPPAVDFRGRAVVLIDDVASTGRTLVAAAQLALAAGAASVDAAVTHGLFVGDALVTLQAAGIRHIWSSDCVPHPSNAIPVAPLLAEGVRRVMAGT